MTGMEPEQAAMMAAAQSAQQHPGAALHWWPLPQVTAPLPTAPLPRPPPVMSRSRPERSLAPPSRAAESAAPGEPTWPSCPCPCGDPVAADARTGRTRVYAHGSACRMRAKRARDRAAAAA
jgi:hypothetical protein